MRAQDPRGDAAAMTEREILEAMLVGGLSEQEGWAILADLSEPSSGPITLVAAREENA